MTGCAFETHANKSCLPLWHASQGRYLTIRQQTQQSHHSHLVTVQTPHSPECTSELQQVISLGHQSWMNTTSSSSPSQCLGTMTSRKASASLMPAKHKKKKKNIYTRQLQNCSLLDKSRARQWCTISIPALYHHIRWIRVYLNISCHEGLAVGFCCLPVLPRKYRGNTWMKPWWLTFKPLPIQHSTTLIQFNIIQTVPR